MLRPIALALAAASLTVASVAAACSCVPYRTQAEADRAGEKVYRAADLIVEATVGDVSARYKAMCHGGSRKPDPATIGQKVSGDRPLTIHRVLKGRAPRTPMLAGNPGEIFAQGCGVMMNSCDVNVPKDSRTILILRKVGAGRYAMESFCALNALRQSTRGQVLFNRAG